LNRVKQQNSLSLSLSLCLWDFDPFGLRVAIIRFVILFACFLFWDAESLILNVDF